MAGSGGALKALAKNLANQLKLNRTQLKRVVARVISERHGEGDVGDYNGHMFFVKPDRIDLTQQITQSKEAFDEMIIQKQRQRFGLKNQMPKSRSRLLTYNKPNKSLIIDQHHVIRPKIKSTKCKSQSQIPKCNNSQMIRQLKPSKSLTKPKSISKLAIQGQTKVVTTRKRVPVKSEVRNLKCKPLKIKRPLSCQGMGSNVQRLNAGRVIQQETSKPNPQAKPEVAPDSEPLTFEAAIKKKKSLKQLTNAKSKLIHKKIWHENWQVTKKITPKSLRAGGILTKLGQVINPLHKNRSALTWHNPYQFPGGAGATQRPNANQCSKSKFEPRINNNKFPISKHFKQSNVKKTKTKRSQVRLAKQLKCEEAIDDTERLEAGSMLSSMVKKSVSTHSRKGKRTYKLSARLEELAKPVLRGNPCSGQMSIQFRSHSSINKPKMKLKSRRRRRRVLVNSSLGSIAGLKGTSGSGLTPANRHLTMAFMNKDTVRSPQRTHRVMWR